MEQIYFLKCLLVKCHRLEGVVALVYDDAENNCLLSASIYISCLSAI